jgi:hypothetical protein
MAVPNDHAVAGALMSSLSCGEDLAAIRDAVIAICSSAGRVRYCLFEHNREERVLQIYVQLTNRELHEGLAHRLGGLVRGRELYIALPVSAQFVMPAERAPERAR